jgi:hypothetical protein
LAEWQTAQRSWITLWIVERPVRLAGPELQLALRGLAAGRFGGLATAVSGSGWYSTFAAAWAQWAAAWGR